MRKYVLYDRQLFCRDFLSAGKLLLIVHPLVLPPLGEFSSSCYCRNYLFESCYQKCMKNNSFKSYNINGMVKGKQWSVKNKAGKASDVMSWVFLFVTTHIAQRWRSRWTEMPCDVTLFPDNSPERLKHCTVRFTNSSRAFHPRLLITLPVSSSPRPPHTIPKRLLSSPLYFLKLIFSTPTSFHTDKHSFSCIYLLPVSF